MLATRWEPPLRPSYQTSSSNNFRCHFVKIAVTFQYSTVATLFHFSTFWNNKKSFFTNKFLFTIFKVVIHIFVIYRSPLVYKYLGLSICCQRSRKPSMKLENIFWMFVLWILYWTEGQNPPGWSLFIFATMLLELLSWEKGTCFSIIVWYRISFHWQRYHIIETCPCSVAIKKVKVSLNCHQSVDSATHVPTDVFLMIPTATAALMRSGSSCSRPAGFLPTIRDFWSYN